MKVAGYIRVSTDGQCNDDRFGLEVQKTQIVEYCTMNNYDIVKWYTDEGESGAKERPGFDEIVYDNDVTNETFECVIVAKSDRVARDINIYFYYKMMLQKKNIKLISISEDFESYGLFAPMLEAFTLCVASMERDNITKRTSAGRIAKAKHGGYAGGRVPYGYKVRSGDLIINEDEAEVVRIIFNMNDNNYNTSYEIQETLTEMGYYQRNGKPFRQDAICKIINNRKFYQGMYKYKGVDWTRGKHRGII